MKEPEFTRQYTFSDLDIGHEMILQAKSFRLFDKGRKFPTHHTIFVIEHIDSEAKEVYLRAKDDVENTLRLAPSEVDSFGWRYARNPVNNGLYGRLPDDYPVYKESREEGLSSEQHAKLLKLFNQYRLTVDMVIRYEGSNSVDSRDARDMANDVANNFRSYLDSLLRDES